VTRRAVLIYNPRSGNQRASRLVPELQGILGRAGFEVEPLPTAGPGDATLLARRAVADGAIEVAFAVGGDGTLREVAAGLAGSEVALGALPAGTVNVLAIELGIPRRPLDAARALADSEIVPIDMGLAGDTPFLMMASGGLDAEVMAQQDAGLKRVLGRAALASAGLRAWWGYGYPEITLEIDGRARQISFFAACNIPFYGGPLRLAPDADCRDGLLDVVLFSGRDRWSTAAFGTALAMGRHLRRGDVEVCRAESLRVDGPLLAGLQIDGDIAPVSLPVSLGVRRHGLRVLVPRRR
jgi:diacylglycerol kinase (ATP)